MRKTPQEKKADSYKHDRRNSYGESDKGSRKSIPRNKAITRRNSRRVAKQKTSLDVEEDDIGVASPGKRPFEKFPDMPLGEFLDFQKTKRAKLVGRKDRARAEHAELQAKLAEERNAELYGQHLREQAAKKKAEIRAAKEKAKS